jgi:hypothetical protein
MASQTALLETIANGFLARREELAAASDDLFEYVDRLATLVTDEYTAERDRFVRSREQRRTLRRKSRRIRRVRPNRLAVEVRNV